VNIPWWRTASLNCIKLSTTKEKILLDGQQIWLYMQIWLKVQSAESGFRAGGARNHVEFGSMCDFREEFA